MEMKWLLVPVGLGVLLMLLFSAPAVAAEAGDGRLPGTSDAMLKAEFWIGKLASPHQQLLSSAGVAAFNQSITATIPQAVVDLDHFSDSQDKSTLRRWLSADRLPRGKELYDDGNLLGGAFYDQLEQNMNLQGLREQNPVGWGFTVRRADLRTFPTDRAASEDDESDDFDQFQETAVNIAEPLALLHWSADSQWIFVQSYNYRGWVNATDVAIEKSRSAWQSRREMKYVMITGTKVVPREVAMGQPIADWRAGMGTRLPFLAKEKEGYSVEIPQRNVQGEVLWRKAWIHGMADVSIGPLPYTRAHILRQAFKMLGENYGWGGLNEGRDCSSFIMDIYSVFAIRAPRNADQQEQVPGRRIVFNGNSDSAARYRLLAKAEPGATLHMRNHVMMYLGTYEGKHYAIHSLGSYGDSSRRRGDGTLPRISVMRVVVGDLNLPLRSGRRLIEALTSTNAWQP